MKLPKVDKTRLLKSSKQDLINRSQVRKTAVTRQDESINDVRSQVTAKERSVSFVNASHGIIIKDKLQSSADRNGVSREKSLATIRSHRL